MVSMVKSRLKPLSSVILGLDPRMTEERVDRPLASAKETSGLSNPNKKKGPPFPVTPHALRWIGEPQCAASGGGAAFGFLISTVRKMSPVNRKVKSRNTSAKARIQACCDTMPTSFLIATDEPSRP